MSACVVRVFWLLWATVAIFAESSNDARWKISQAEKEAELKSYKDHCRLSSSRPPPSYSKAKNTYGEPVWRLNATWERRCIVTLLLLVLLTDCFSQNSIVSSLSTFVRHTVYSINSKFKTFSAYEHTRQDSELVQHKRDVWIDSRISAPLNWIEFDTSEMRRMSQT